MKNRHWITLGLVGYMALAALVAWYARAANRASITTRAASSETRTLELLGDRVPVPSFSARDLNGRLVSSDEWRGKVTLVNFWATWCGPCRTEIPELVALQDTYRDQLQIVGVAVDEGSVEAVKQFVAEHKINYVVVMETPELQEIFPGVLGLPATFLLDRDGRIAQQHIGILDPTRTEEEVRAFAGLP
ncbi:MAG: TlpA family protein disulfide reductase [Acidobacteria bacterium]|nr:TlpA family protein disulfide reductase [Acidobacteriota bacterium]